MKKLLKFLPLGSLVFFVPVVALAQVTFVNPPTKTCTGTGLGLLICNAQQLLNSIIPVLIALGVLYFVWGVVRYVIADGEEAKTKGRDSIIYGVLGLVIITGLWGLVNIIVKTFSLSSTAPTLSAITGTGASCVLGSSAKFQDLLCYVTGIINNSIIPLLFALATAFFVWGVVQFFILNADDAEKRSQGKQFMIWSIVALAVMLSVWGLVGILSNTFGINGNILPQVKPPGSSSQGSFQGPCPGGGQVNPTTGGC